VAGNTIMVHLRPGPPLDKAVGAAVRYKQFLQIVGETVGSARRGQADLVARLETGQVRTGGGLILRPGSPAGWANC
jgi:hypothetical protein